MHHWLIINLRVLAPWSDLHSRHFIILVRDKFGTLDDTRLIKVSDSEVWTELNVPDITLRARWNTWRSMNSKVPTRLSRVETPKKNAANRVGVAYVAANRICFPGIRRNQTTATNPDWNKNKSSDILSGSQKPRHPSTLLNQGGFYADLDQRGEISPNVSRKKKRCIPFMAISTLKSLNRVPEQKKKNQKFSWVTETQEHATRDFKQEEKKITHFQLPPTKNLRPISTRSWLDGTGRGGGRELEIGFWFLWRRKKNTMDRII